jgi:hypothetical protein
MARFVIVIVFPLGLVRRRGLGHPFRAEIVLLQYTPKFRVSSGDRVTLVLRRE